MENASNNQSLVSEKLSFDRFRQEVLKDYKMACESREASLLGRKEVLTGKAKFGIFGDGKEVAQIAAAKFFRPGDFLSGYYRDQTFSFALGEATVEQFFSQLYADANPEHEPHSSGRNMNSHFSTPNVDPDGEWLDLVNRHNIAAPMAPTAAQMPRSVGLAFGSKLFRNSAQLRNFSDLSDNGNEVCFCTIGDASTSEGHFWEAVNAAGVMQIPLAIFVWDDGYGISVPRKYQTTKGSISEALRGMQKRDNSNGVDIYKVKAWDYAGMCEVFDEAIERMRATHVPAVFHVEEVTQPQGHSTSGSHERYKTPERLEWERAWDGNKKMRQWIIENALASEDEIEKIETAAKNLVKKGRQDAWDKYITPIKELIAKTVALLDELIGKDADQHGRIAAVRKQLFTAREPFRKEILQAIHTVLLEASVNDERYSELRALYQDVKQKGYDSYGSFLYHEGPRSPLRTPAVAAEFNPDSPTLNGYEVINRYFDELIATNPKVIAFGEDVGKIGDVNQGFAGLQVKHGENRIFDTGIRELSIMGQGIGLAFRGLRPIAEIQYLDYVVYGLQPLTDDAACMHWRTGGKQSAPLIVRTRGHRLEGIWHSGSPMGMIINALRGMHICVPRNMVQAVGMYNILLAGNDPALVVESLNGYRLKEKLPSNLVDFKVPLGVPEFLRSGDDVTVVSYGSTLRICQEAAASLAELGISCEVIDVQTLLPFDINHMIVESLKKTNRILFVDEDVPGGAAGYMFTEVIEKQKGYKWLDVAARTITSKPHRPSYGTDGDYFSKPNKEEIIDAIREMMAE